MGNMKPRPVEQIIKDMEAMGTSPKTIDQTIKNLSNHITAQLENMKGVTAVGDNVKLYSSSSANEQRNVARGSGARNRLFSKENHVA